MNEQTKDFISNFIEFSDGSMKWCCNESENASSSIMSILDHLLSDAERVSKMSQDTLDAVQTLKKIKLEKQGQSDDNMTKDLISGLVQLTQQHQDVAELIHPIIEALQFQDRITQNMQNMVKMLGVWWASRSSWENGGDKEKMSEFAHALYEKTTMVEERDLLRGMWPSLPAEPETQDAILF